MPFRSTPIPATIWSAILAFGLTVVTGGIWTALLASNLAIDPAIPWAVIVMAFLLWLLWLYLGGKWGPRNTSQTRHRYLRARLVSGPIFAWAVVAGVLSIVALVGFWIVVLQLVKIPTRILPNYSNYPLLTVILVLVMASLVSSVVEEAGFRGYFQSILETKVNGLVAIGMTALLIAPAHGLTQGFAWPILLWYFCADVMFGTMAFFTRSILPGIVVHSLGLLIFFTLVWPYDSQRDLVWETGPSTGFWLTCALAIVFSILAILAFSQLARSTKHLRTPGNASVLPASTDGPVG